jgi:hypothetical protein
VSHKARYGGKNLPIGKRQKRLEAALTKALSFMLQVYRVGFEVGFLEGRKQTTTGSGSAVSPVTNIGHGASRKPNGRNK